MSSSPVVILADQRSGTNLLRRSLSTCSLFTDCSEIFHPRSYRSNKSLLIANTLKFLRGQKREPEKNFWNFKRILLLRNPSLSYPSIENNRKLFCLYLKNLEQCSGQIPLIDIKYNSVHHLDSFWRHASYEPPFLFELLADLEIPIIHLIRQNSFESYVSFQMAETSRVWVSKESSIHDHSQIEIKLDDMFAGIHKRQDEIRLYQTWLSNIESLKVLELSYESLLNGECQFAHNIKMEIFNFLGITEDFLLKIPTKKLVSKPMSQLIINYDQVSSALIKQGFSQFL